jgi:hypothetical protein
VVNLHWCSDRAIARTVSGVVMFYCRARELALVDEATVSHRNSSSRSTAKAVLNITLDADHS